MSSDTFLSAVRLKQLDDLYDAYNQMDNNRITSCSDRMDRRDTDFIRRWAESIRSDSALSLSSRIAHPHSPELQAVKQLESVLRKAFLRSAPSEEVPAQEEKKEAVFRWPLPNDIIENFLGYYLTPDEMQQFYSGDPSLTLASTCIRKHNLLPIIQDYLHLKITSEKDALAALAKLVRSVEEVCEIEKIEPPASYADLTRILSLLEEKNLEKLLKKYGARNSGDLEAEMRFSFARVYTTTFSGITLFPKRIVPYFTALTGMCFESCFRLLPGNFSQLETLVQLRLEDTGRVVSFLLPPNLTNLELRNIQSLQSLALTGQLKQLKKVEFSFSRSCQLLEPIPGELAQAESLCVREWYTGFREVQRLLLPFEKYMQVCSRAPDHGDFLKTFDLSPLEFRHAVYKFTCLIAKNRGCSIDHERYGELAFRKEEGRDVANEMRERACAYALLEQLILPLLEKGQQEQTEQALLLFVLLDSKYQKDVFKQLKYRCSDLIFAYGVHSELDLGLKKIRNAFSSSAEVRQKFKESQGYDFLDNGFRIEAIRSLFKSLN